MQSFCVGDDFFEAGNVFGDGAQRRVIVIGAGKLEQLRAIPKSGIEAFQRADHAFELFLFLAERLCALLIVPDLGIFELLLDFRQPLRLHIEVKDTSAGRRFVPANPTGWTQSG